MTGPRSGAARPGQWLHHPRHGPVPALLLLLTIATGVVDAVSILGPGRMLIASMRILPGPPEVRPGPLSGGGPSAQGGCVGTAVPSPAAGGSSVGGKAVEKR